MKERRKIGRWMAVMATGGCLMQVAGCLSGFVPIIQSVGESVLLSVLLSSTITP